MFDFDSIFGEGLASLMSRGAIENVGCCRGKIVMLVCWSIVDSFLPRLCRQLVEIPRGSKLEDRQLQKSSQRDRANMRTSAAECFARLAASRWQYAAVMSITALQNSCSFPDRRAAQASTQIVCPSHCSPRASAMFSGSSWSNGAPRCCRFSQTSSASVDPRRKVADGRPSGYRVHAHRIALRWSESASP